MRIICNLHKDHCITRFRHGYRWITLRSPNSALMLLFSRFFKSFFSKYLSINSFTIFSVFHFLLVYLQMMQDNITRMAINSTNCKSWMVMLMSGFLALGCSINDLNGWIWIAIIPVIIFWYLDSYYLEMERKMRNRELDFIIKAKGKDDIEAYNKALYNFKPLSMNSISHEQEIQGFVITNNRWYTSSIIPLYGGTIMIIIVLTVIINFDSILKLLNIH